MRRRLLAIFVAWALLAVPAGGLPGRDHSTADARALTEYRAAAADEPLLQEFDDNADVCPIPSDDPPTRKQRRRLVKLGRKLFRSIDAFGQQPSLGPTVRGQGLSCVGCHGGKGTTDGRNHVVGPTERRDAVIRQTPHLMGIKDAAPYGWDGRFPCLQAVIKNAIVSPGEMNAAKEPTRRQLDALTAFRHGNRPSQP